MRLLKGKRRKSGDREALVFCSALYAPGAGGGLLHCGEVARLCSAMEGFIPSPLYVLHENEGLLWLGSTLQWVTLLPRPLAARRASGCSSVPQQSIPPAGNKDGEVSSCHPITQVHSGFHFHLHRDPLFSRWILVHEVHPPAKRWMDSALST